MTRPPGGGLVGRLLSGLRGRGARSEEPRGGGQASGDAAQRLAAAQQRLKDEIPPPEEPQRPPPEEPQRPDPAP